ncbi:hypothetical protein [Paenibacillus taichungensis]|uniref:hypothetical protein n=1 Tax=Paenibacillus taichungensis TaxID=484184 RepID=UPI0038D24761
MFNDKPLTLITGANGQPGSRVEAMLQRQHFRCVWQEKKPASSDSADNYVYFDWYDSTTYGPALKNVDQVYLVVPVMDMHPEDVMIPFIIDGRKEEKIKRRRRYLKSQGKAHFHWSSLLGSICNEGNHRRIL